MRRRAESLGIGFRELLGGLRRLFRGYPFVMAGLAATWFGLVMLCGGADVFARSPAFRTMADLAPQASWGWSVFTIGVVYMAALVVSPHQAWIVAMAGLPIFAFVSITMFASVGIWSTGGGLYFLVAGLFGWAASERI